MKEFEREQSGPLTGPRRLSGDDGAPVVETMEEGFLRARAILRRFIPEGVNLSGELITERRAEAAREEANAGLQSCSRPSYIPNRA
jgi:hypothetical protein